MNYLKKTLCAAMLLGATATVSAQGWPSNYEGVMLQAFSWDSYTQSQWFKLEQQADELAEFFSLVWIPQSGKAANNPSMGYDPLYWYNQNSSFGTEAELRSFISAMKQRGSGVVADVVINHRGNLSDWFNFPTEKNPYDGNTYSMGSTDICRNDDGGATLAEANKRNPRVNLSENNDTGEDWGGMRDLDHISDNVQKNVKAYLKYLINYLGYTGFRYDMVKGYSGSYTGMYNKDCGVKFSVGECWDGTNTIREWIDATQVDGIPQSAAFDFQFRYTVRNAANNGQWDNLGKQNDGNWPLIYNNYRSGSYRRWAVTFVENHDTQYRDPKNPLDPIKRDTLAANAFLLAMPGTPCIFQPHWLAYKQEIKAMIDARRLAGITNESSYSAMRTNADYFATLTKTNNENRLIAIVGKNTTAWVPSEAQYTEILSGYHYKYFMARTLETAWATVSSGEFANAFDVQLIAVSADDNARLVYTLDGSNPTASSTAVNSGAKVNIAEACTLKVGLLSGGAVKGIITRHYTFKKEPPVTDQIPDCAVYVAGKPFAYFEKPDDWGARINVWAWMSGGDGAQYVGTGWPGVQATRVGATSTGQEVWQWISTKSEAPDNIIFNDGGNQTSDMAFTNGGYYTKDGLRWTITPSDINSIFVAEETLKQPVKVYTLDGRLVRTMPAGSTVGESLNGLANGLYIVGGKKFAK